MDFRRFLDESPTPFQAVRVLTEALDGAGFISLSEGEAWDLKPSQGYYVERGGRAAAAFITGTGKPWDTGLRMGAAHLDSPCLKAKVEAAHFANGSLRVPVEIYGGPIFRSWPDRELLAAGIVYVRDSEKGSRPLHWKSSRPLGIIPSLAIHFSRDMNKGEALNPRDHLSVLMPGFRDGSGSGGAGMPDGNPFVNLIAGDLGVAPEEILSSEIYFLPSQPAEVLGEGEGALIASGRLDNLAMAHVLLSAIEEADSEQAFAQASGQVSAEVSTQASGQADTQASGQNHTQASRHGRIVFWFDAEEVGSQAPGGAFTIFPDEVIERIVLAAGGGREELMRTRRLSMLASLDMAHAVNPNYADKHDSAYPAQMGGGPVLKSHGKKHYATDALSEAVMADFALKAGVPLQKFIVRSDQPCGFSLGPLAASMTAVPTVDMGNPLWAMHSTRETASLKDHQAMIRLINVFLNDPSSGRAG